MWYKYGTTKGTVYSGKDNSHRYMETWKQPMHRWLIAEMYHWYDSIAYKLPGFNWLDDKLHDRHNKNRTDPDDWYVPLGARLDIRCYFLMQKGRIVLERKDIF